MTKLNNLFLGGSLLLATTICSQETQTRKLSPFNSLEVGGSMDVILESGSEESAKVVAEGVSPDKIVTEVKSNTLEVYMENGNYRNIKVKVYVTYKRLEAIDKTGSGKLTCNSDLTAPSFKLSSGGSGNMIINKKIQAARVTLATSGSGSVKLETLEADDADLHTSGSGNFEIGGGHAKNQAIHLSGSGNVNAYGLKTNECNASVSGSGSIDISVSQSLEGRIAGSGNINYQGDAQITKSTIVGSGRIHRK
jgi:hypothetical protein